jgi:hypothetical protein
LQKLGILLNSGVPQVFQPTDAFVGFFEGGLQLRAELRAGPAFARGAVVCARRRRGPPQLAPGFFGFASRG